MNVVRILRPPAMVSTAWYFMPDLVLCQLRPFRKSYEFNFAPSTQWAAYRFASYRSHMRAATAMNTPAIAVQSSADRFTLEAALELEELTDLPRNASLRLGLSAVIEETSGHKSYWALAHPPGKPDFHHSDGFAYELS